MTTEEIIAMAREANLPVQHIDWVVSIEAFAKLVAEAEREECARIVQKNANICYGDSRAFNLLSSNAEAIRNKEKNHA